MKIPTTKILSNLQEELEKMGLDNIEYGRWNDLVNTFIRHALNDLIENVMNSHENKLLVKKNIEMKLFPEFKQLFSNAPGLSSK